MRVILAAILLVLSAQVTTEEALLPLFDFGGPEAAQQWQAVNDGVMGGVSDGRFKVTEEGTLEFFGTLSPKVNVPRALIGSAITNSATTQPARKPIE